MEGGHLPPIPFLRKKWSDKTLLPDIIMVVDWDRMPDAMMVLDAGGFLVESNRRFTRTVGPMSTLRAIDVAQVTSAGKVTTPGWWPPLGGGLGESTWVVAAPRGACMYGFHGESHQDDCLDHFGRGMGLCTPT
jgi:hypothetical protein